MKRSLLALSLVSLLVAGCESGGGPLDTGPGPRDTNGADIPALDVPAVDAPPPASCDGITCSDHGTCTEDPVRCVCDDGYVASGLTCIEETIPSTGDLFVDLPETGLVRATVHPTELATLGAPTTVTFGAPFPRDAVAAVGMVRLTDASGTELPAHVSELARWRALGTAGAESVRAALIQVQLTFTSRDPVELQVHWGTAPASSPGRMGDPWADWAPIDESTFFADAYPAADDVREPTAYVTFPADWLGSCILRTRTEPFGTDAGWGFFDDVAPQYARTGVNDVDPRVTAGNRIDYVTAEEPWLFQRALTLFGMYLRSGDVAWLRHAHRATQFYASHLSGSGYFDLADGDLKYAYGSALFLDLMLLGDTRHLPRIEAVASAGEDWNETYTAGTGFWTERHQTYALLAALVAWEATGDADHGARAIAVARESFRMAREPVSGWPVEGCILHTQESHEGDGVEDPICSPWMSALLAEAVFRYYVHSEDAEALTFLADLAGFVATTGSAEDGDGISPYYLVSSARSDEPDIEHACDVAGLVARGLWSAEVLGRDTAALRTNVEGLLTNCRANLEEWHRPGGPEAGLSEWRLSPARKLNWWFGTTLDLPWLIDAP